MCLFGLFMSSFSLSFGLFQVHRKLASSSFNGDMYETELLEQFSDTDATKEFFACLDQQLNKVNMFYRTKEKEFMDRGDSLKKQMEILLVLKSTFKEQQSKAGSSHGSKEDQSISSTFSNGTQLTLSFYFRYYIIQCPQHEYLFTSLFHSKYFLSTSILDSIALKDFSTHVKLHMHFNLKSLSQVNHLTFIVKKKC